MTVAAHVSINIHPGVWLRTDIVEPHAIEVEDIAANFRSARSDIEALLAGHVPITPEMALRFERAFSVKADTLLRMQIRYDLARAREIVDVERIRSYI